MSTARVVELIPTDKYDLTLNFEMEVVCTSKKTSKICPNLSKVAKKKESKTSQSSLKRNQGSKLNLIMSLKAGLD
jgi:hypothetical protein